MATTPQTTMDILVDFAGTVLHIADSITTIVSEFPNEPVVWQVTPFFSVQDYGYTKYTVTKDTTVQPGTHRYDATKGFYLNPDFKPEMDVQEVLMQTRGNLENLMLAKAESELEIEERISKLELGLA